MTVTLDSGRPPFDRPAALAVRLFLPFFSAVAF